MSFSDDLRRFREKVARRQGEIFLGVLNALHESIVNGSIETGSPGQPVQSGALRGSWQVSIIREFVGQTISNQSYGPNIEAGIGRGDRPMTLRSTVGGFHSVKLTIAGFQQLVDAEAFKVTVI